MYYKIIDPLFLAGAGAIIAFTVAEIIPASMPMALAMLVGGVLGMAMNMLFTVLFAPFLGAFQVMMALGLVAMPLGMAAAMAENALPLPLLVLIGAASGLAVALYIGRANRRLTGGRSR